MANTINYNSEEVAEARSIITQSVSILESDILTALSSSFTALTELDLFSDGISKLQSQVETLISDHNTFAGSLSAHDNDLSTFEGTQATAVNQYINSYSGEAPYYEGESTPTTEVEISHTEEGTKISDKELQEIVESLPYESKIQALKNIMNAKGLDLTSLLTDEDNSNILSCLLKRMLTNSTAEINSTPTEYEKNIQETLLESIANEDEDAFAKLGENTFLQGMPYLKEVASDNNIDLSSLILDDKYSGILVESIKKMYSGDSETMLTSTELSGVKNYIDTIASSNNISVDELLSNKNNIDLIKGGNKK